MKDEIKEINIKISGQILDYVDTKEHLLDLFNYITNLQQENSNLKILNQALNNELGLKLYELDHLDEKRNDLKKDELQQYVELQQENERLKETNVYCNRTDCVGRIKDSRKYDSVYQEKEDYKSRCEKAIELYQNCKEEDWCTLPIDMVNILQKGSDSQ